MTGFKNVIDGALHELAKHPELGPMFAGFVESLKAHAARTETPIDDVIGQIIGAVVAALMPKHAATTGTVVNVHVGEQVAANTDAPVPNGANGDN